MNTRKQQAHSHLKNHARPPDALSRRRNARTHGPRRNETNKSLLRSNDIHTTSNVRRPRDTQHVRTQPTNVLCVPSPPTHSLARVLCSPSSCFETCRPCTQNTRGKKETNAQIARYPAAATTPSATTTLSSAHRLSAKVKPLPPGGVSPWAKVRPNPAPGPPEAATVPGRATSHRHHHHHRHRYRRILINQGGRLRQRGIKVRARPHVRHLPGGNSRGAT